MPRPATLVCLAGLVPAVSYCALDLIGLAARFHFFLRRSQRALVVPLFIAVAAQVKKLRRCPEVLPAFRASSVYISHGCFASLIVNPFCVYIYAGYFLEYRLVKVGQ